MVALADAVNIAAPWQSPSDRCAGWSMLRTHFCQVLDRSEEMRLGRFSGRAHEYIQKLDDALRMIAPPLAADPADDRAETIGSAA
jgi:hypothetical protein